MNLKLTPLHDVHQKLGARMVPFAGYSMPVQYLGLAAEHIACRTKAAVFDVSHMGEIWVTGTGAEVFLQWLLPNDLSKCQDFHAQYNLFINEQGTVEDDLIVYRYSSERFLLVVNASNTESDFLWVQSRASTFSNVQIQNVSDSFSQLAVQGPGAIEFLKTQLAIFGGDLPSFGFREEMHPQFGPLILSRTGYTGEDGLEIYLPNAGVNALFEAIVEKGRDFGIIPAGLGARDTLRLEMKYPLYGHELSREIDPFEAGMGWAVKLNKGEFLGKKALIARKESGLQKKLVGLRVLGRGVPRDGYEVSLRGKTDVIGKISSGTHSPSLQAGIGLVFLPLEHSSIGEQLAVNIRGTWVDAEIVQTPFVQTSKLKK